MSIPDNIKPQPSNINFIALQTASKAFATKCIPDNWQELDEDAKGKWLDEHRWTHFEDVPVDELYALIDVHAYTIKEAVELSLVILKEKLVDAAIEDKLPLDVNDLNLEHMLGMG